MRKCHRIAERTEAAQLARTLVDLLPAEDAELNRDLTRLDQVKQKRDMAQSYFRENAEHGIAYGVACAGDFTSRS